MTRLLACHGFIRIFMGTIMGRQKSACDCCEKSDTPPITTCGAVWWFRNPSFCESVNLGAFKSTMEFRDERANKSQRCAPQTSQSAQVEFASEVCVQGHNCSELHQRALP